MSEKMKKTEEFASRIGKLLSGIQLSPEQKKWLEEKAPGVSWPGKNLWDQEFQASHLAMGAIIWERVCEEVKPLDGKPHKLFLRYVTKSFESPQKIDFASAFSEYYCAGAEEVEEAYAVLIARKLIRRSGLSFSSEKNRDDFLLGLIWILESFRSGFENQIIDFLAPLTPLPE